MFTPLTQVLRCAAARRATLGMFFTRIKTDGNASQYKFHLNQRLGSMARKMNFRLSAWAAPTAALSARRQRAQPGIGASCPPMMRTRSPRRHGGGAL